MSDPERLVDTRGGLALSLLEAGRSEVASPASLQRALATVSVAAAATAATSSGAAASSLGAGLWFKWMGIGALGGLVSMGAVQVVSSQVSVSRSYPPTATQAAAVPAVGPLPAAAAKHEPAPTAAADPTAAPDPTPLAAAASATHSAARGRAAPPAERDSLAAELSRIDAARLRLNSGDAQATLALLDAYARDYPEPNFGQEALLLRIESHVVSGHCSRARALGSGFLNLHEKSALGQRVRSLLARCGAR